MLMFLCYVILNSLNIFLSIFYSNYLGKAYSRDTSTLLHDLATRIEDVAESHLPLNFVTTRSPIPRVITGSSDGRIRVSMLVLIYNNILFLYIH